MRRTQQAVLSKRARAYVLAWGALLAVGLLYFRWPGGLWGQQARRPAASASARATPQAGVLTRANQVRPPGDLERLQFRLAWPERLDVQAITRLSLKQGPPAILEWRGTMSRAVDGGARFELGSVRAEPLPEGDEALLLAKLGVFQGVLPTLEIAPGGELRSTASAEQDATRIRAALLSAFPSAFPPDMARALLEKAINSATLNASAQAWVQLFVLPLAGKTLGTLPSDRQLSQGSDVFTGVRYRTRLSITGKTRCYLDASDARCAHGEHLLVAADESHSIEVRFVTDVERLLPHWYQSTTKMRAEAAAASALSTEFRYEQLALER